MQTVGNCFSFTCLLPYRQNIPVQIVIYIYTYIYVLKGSCKSFNLTNYTHRVNKAGTTFCISIHSLSDIFMDYHHLNKHHRRGLNLSQQSCCVICSAHSLFIVKYTTNIYVKINEYPRNLSVQAGFKLRFYIISSDTRHL